MEDKTAIHLTIDPSIHWSTKFFFSKGTELVIDFRVYWGRWTWTCT